MKSANAGRPKTPISPNTPLSKKLNKIVLAENYNSAAIYFGVKRDAAKKYLTGERVPDSISLACLRHTYGREHGGLLIDVNWLLDDSDAREGPIFSEIEPHIMNRVEGLHAYFVGIHNKMVFYHTKITRGTARNLVPLVLGGEPEHTKTIPLTQEIALRIKGTDIIPEFGPDDYIPDDASVIQTRDLCEHIPNIAHWLLEYMAIGTATGAGGVLGKRIMKSVIGKVKDQPARTPHALSNDHLKEKSLSAMQSEDLPLVNPPNANVKEADYWRGRAEDLLKEENARLRQELDASRAEIIRLHKENGILQGKLEAALEKPASIRRSIGSA